MSEPIRKLDRYDVQLRFGEEVSATIHVWVVPVREAGEEAPADTPAPAAPPPAASPKPPEEPPASTASRLLEAKRRAQKRKP